jgi:proton-coupled amino acid transporter|eukprot:evm.model.NODE_38576_length_7909_cov_18.513340.1
MLNEALVETTPPTPQQAHDAKHSLKQQHRHHQNQGSSSSSSSSMGQGTSTARVQVRSLEEVVEAEEIAEMWKGTVPPLGLQMPAPHASAYTLLGEDSEGDHKLEAGKKIETGSPSTDAPPAHHLQGVMRTAIAFTRSMIGTAALYMPRMFYTGGLAFSTITLIAACCISTYSIILLSRAHDRLPGTKSYGDVVYRAWGRPGKWLVDFLLALNQISWVPVYFLFVQQNVAQAIPGLDKVFSREALIAIQLLVYVPLSWLRHIKYLATANLIANVFVGFGLAACLVWSCTVLATDGPAADIHMFNRNSCFLFLGSVAVAFEGMSLVLPIKRSMKRPERFEKLVATSMAGLCVLVWSIGAVGYLAFGNDVEPFVTNELPTTGLLGPAVRIMYSLAILATYPLQLFPGTLILEEYLVEPMGLVPSKRKVAKNGLRMCVVCCTCLTAIYAGKALDHFVSLIGTVGSLPLGLMLPTLVHLCLFWRTTTVAMRVVHVGLVLVGCLAIVLSCAITLSTW